MFNLWFKYKPTIYILRDNISYPIVLEEKTLRMKIKQNFSATQFVPHLNYGKWIGLGSHLF